MTQVMERLKTETADLHHAAERAEFQQRMVGGRLTRQEYVGWLGQMYLVHRALEAPLRRLWGDDPRFAALTAEQYQEPYLVADLETLGADPAAVVPLPATRALCERIELDAGHAPLRLLGYHYVLEGSNNGNRFIVRSLRPALGLTPGSGDRYLDPYGEAQVEIWRGFKEAMAAVAFTAAEEDALVAAARDMFAAITRLSEELAPAVGVEPSPRSTP